MDFGVLARAARPRVRTERSYSAARRSAARERRTFERAVGLCAWLLFGAAAPAAAEELLAHTRTPQTTPTFDNSGQAVHPDVLWVPEGWSGYEYWMVMTPYPCGDETAENPSVLASHDGRSWEVPAAGGRNAPAPLVENPEACNAYAYYNNDPCLVLVGDTLAVYYLVTWRFGPRAGTTQMKRIVSTDGVRWSHPDQAPVGLAQINYTLSPSIVHDQDGWRMWYVKMTACGSGDAEVRMRTSVDGIEWPAWTERTVRIRGNYVWPFHLTVRRVGDVYVMLYVGSPNGEDCTHANTLYYAESSDGETWVAFDTPLLAPTRRTEDWDGRVIYRAAFVGRYPNIGVWYSATGDATCRSCPQLHAGPAWRIGYTGTGDYRRSLVARRSEASNARLAASYPNPLTSQCTVAFEVEKPGRMRLEVFDLLGRRVATLADALFGQGRYAVTWRGKSEGARPAPPGIYMVRLVGDNVTKQSGRLVVVN